MTLVKMVHATAPETPINTVHGAVHSLLSKTNEIVRPSKGLWVLKKHAEGETPSIDLADEPEKVVEVQTHGKKLKVAEEEFYEPFAEWLKNAAEEVVEAMVIGGSMMKTKWGTPDVIGVYKPLKSDFIQFPLEIVSAEIKLDQSQSVTAFGQACAYRLFSHTSYIVIPDSIAPDDQNRLEALCSLYGVGLILFKPDPKDPQFVMIVKAQKYQPDMFFANEFARRLHDYSKNDFNRLF